MYHCFYLSLYLSIHLVVFLSVNLINRPLTFPKYQYIIAADLGASIGLVKVGKIVLLIP